jgi:hypothetical protein
MLNGNTQCSFLPTSFIAHIRLIILCKSGKIKSFADKKRFLPYNADALMDESSC